MTTLPVVGGWRILRRNSVLEVLMLTLCVPNTSLCPEHTNTPCPEHTEDKIIELLCSGTASFKIIIFENDKMNLIYLPIINTYPIILHFHLAPWFHLFHLYDSLFYFGGSRRPQRITESGAGHFPIGGVVNSEVQGQTNLRRWLV